MMLDARLSDRDKSYPDATPVPPPFQDRRPLPSLHILALELSLGENEDSTKRVVAVLWRGLRSWAGSSATLAMGVTGSTEAIFIA